jgi:hypothetical protein
MEDILILKDKTGGTAVLTVYSPQSHYGIPVLRIESDEVNEDFGPADLIDTLSVGGDIFPAANIVFAWTQLPGRTAGELKAARLFLSQWPEGPQIVLTA